MTPVVQKVMLASLWVLWCTAHSILISRATIRKLQALLGPRYAYYRFFYVLVSIMTLVPILYFEARLPRSVIFAGQGYWRVMQFLLAVYGLMFMVGGLMIYDLRYMLGIRQIRQHWRRQPESPPTLVVRGVLKYVRHPWYAAGLAFLWSSSPITDVNIIGRLVLSVYLVVGALLEGKKLLLDFGSDYERYRRAVPMFFPWRLFQRYPSRDWPAGPD